jgi:hypothetical protein
MTIKELVFDMLGGDDKLISSDKTNLAVEDYFNNKIENIEVAYEKGCRKIRVKSYTNRKGYPRKIGLDGLYGIHKIPGRYNFSLQSHKMYSSVRIDRKVYNQLVPTVMVNTH